MLIKRKWYLSILFYDKYLVREAINSSHSYFDEVHFRHVITTMNKKYKTVKTVVEFHAYYISTDTE